MYLKDAIRYAQDEDTSFQSNKQIFNFSHRGRGNSSINYSEGLIVQEIQVGIITIVIIDILMLEVPILITIIIFIS